MTYQAVSMRTLPAKFLEIPSHSSIRIIKGFAKASALCDIYSHLPPPADPSMIDAFVFYGRK